MMGAVPELLRRRRTVRRVRRDPVPEALIDTLVEAALLAPSAHNAQPWRFVLLRTAAARASLARAMGDAFRADLEADGLAPAEVQARVQGSLERLNAAPLLIVACLAVEDLQAYGDVARQVAEHLLGAQSVAAAVENLLLAAADAGLGAGWMCAPLFCQEVVRQALDLPAGWEPQALVTVGWPDESPPVPPRRAQEGIVVSR